MAVAEITGDDHPDIVVAAYLTDEVWVFPSLGSGIFGTSDSFTTRAGAAGDAPRFMAVLDVTGDDFADVVTVNENSDDIAVLVGDGSGGLLPPVPFTARGALGCDAPQHLATGDMDEDGEPDVVVGCFSSGSISVMFGNAGGALFDAPVEYDAKTLVSGVGTSLSEVAVADVDGDTHLDVVASAVSGDELIVWLNNGDGSLADPMYTPNTSGYNGGSPYSLAVMDFDGDDIGDVSNERLLTMVGYGDGRFASSQVRVIDQSAWGLDVGDVDKDGLIDLVVADRVDDEINRILQNDVGDWTETTYTFGSLADGAEDVYLPDLDDDGWLDARHLTVADVTGDSVDDIVTCVDTGLDRVYIRTGDGDGTFGSPIGYDLDIAIGGDNPEWIRVAEVNGDAFPDILAVTGSTNDVVIFPGLGGGVLGVPYAVPAVFGGATANLEQLAVGDFNDDGEIDFVTSHYSTGEVSIVLGFGDGQFSAPQHYYVGGNPRALAVADFDGDGIVDVAVANTTGDDITILISSGHPE